MKLSEALILRKDIQSRLDEMENRLCACALTQEGESPAEDPAALDWFAACVRDEKPDAVIMTGDLTMLQATWRRVAPNVQAAWT